MPSKKKKYNARFPAGRIKKIMQSDEEVGKVAQAVPIIISRTLELFVESMLTKTVRITNARNAKTLSPSHLKQCIMSENRFDFLRELVKNVPDINIAEEQMTGDNYLDAGEFSDTSTNDPATGPSTSMAPKRNYSGVIVEATSSIAETQSLLKSRFTKQQSLDVPAFVSKIQNFYTERMPEEPKPLDYSKTSNLPKLTRVDSAPANMTATAPVMSFDFTKVPFLGAASTSTSFNNGKPANLPSIPEPVKKPEPPTTPSTPCNPIEPVIRVDLSNLTSIKIDYGNLNVMNTPSVQPQLMLKTKNSKQKTGTQSTPLASTSTKSVGQRLNHSRSYPSATASSSSTPSSPMVNIMLNSITPQFSFNVPPPTLTNPSTLDMDEDYDNI